MARKPSGSASRAELELRRAIAARLDQARRALEELARHSPKPGAVEAGVVPRSAQTCADLLAEAAELNTALFELDGLSAEGALGARSVSAAVSQAVAALETLRARLGHGTAA